MSLPVFKVRIFVANNAAMSLAEDEESVHGTPRMVRRLPVSVLFLHNVLSAEEKEIACLCFVETIASHNIK